jgi:hypothetical protein
MQKKLFFALFIFVITFTLVNAQASFVTFQETMATGYSSGVHGIVEGDIYEIWMDGVNNIMEPDGWGDDILVDDPAATGIIGGEVPTDETGGPLLYGWIIGPIVAPVGELIYLKIYGHDVGADHGDLYCVSISDGPGGFYYVDPAIPEHVICDRTYASRG